MSQQSKQQKDAVERVMHEFQHGELDRSRGGKVKNPKQAIAIALHEAGVSKYQSPKKNRENLRRAKSKQRHGETGQAMAEGRSAAARIGMEGAVASWYAKNTASAMPEFVALARGGFPEQMFHGPRSLEWPVQATSLSNSPSSAAASSASTSAIRSSASPPQMRRAGIDIVFRQGDAAALPFSDDSFDLVVCRAAFKNFSDPVGGIREMHRVLRAPGVARILDLRADAGDPDIAAEVEKMGLGASPLSSPRAILRRLRRRAYLRDDFERMIASTPFERGEFTEGGIGFEIRMVKREEQKGAKDRGTSAGPSRSEFGDASGAQRNRLCE